MLHYYDMATTSYVRHLHHGEWISISDITMFTGSDVQATQRWQDTDTVFGSYTTGVNGVLFECGALYTMQGEIPWVIGFSVAEKKLRPYSVSVAFFLTLLLRQLEALPLPPK